MSTKIIYINLDSDTNRRDGMEKHLNLLGKKNYERFSAFRGEDITVKHNQKEKRSQGDYGCLYSHIAALKSQENVDDDYVLVLEDDARFLYNFDMNKLWSMVGKDVDIIQLYSHISNDELYKIIVKVNVTDTFLNWKHLMYGTQSYVIRKSSIPKITKYIDIENRVLDMTGYYNPLVADMVIYDSVKTISLTSPLFYFEDYVSTIHPSHDEQNKKSMIRRLQIKPNNTLKKILTHKYNSVYKNIFNTTMSYKRNIFLYWVGKEYKLIIILRYLIYLYSTTGKGYNVILINHENLNEYIDEIPPYFYNLCPAHQADFVRVNVICDYGGIWLDSDTLVLDSLDSLFDIIENKDGFLILENNEILSNGIFGSKKNTNFMKEWKNRLIIKLDNTKGKIGWTDIGCKMVQNIFISNPSLCENYTIFQGLDNLYPVNWDKCVTEYINKPYYNCINIIREYQPLIVLVNSVYKKLENKTFNDILYGTMPINYFINKSIKNKIERFNHNSTGIGTINFDTLIENVHNDTIRIYVDAVKHYINYMINQNLKNKN
jgi:GR25 family glycosyltransferase involved in LPS biosynthesis